MKPLELNKILSNINLIMFENKENNESDYRKHIVELLRPFAKHFHVELRKSDKDIISISEAYKKFLLNHEGYNKTLNQFYNALIQ